MYRFCFRPYHRVFCNSLLTAHGRWTVRQGIILRLMDGQGQQGFGEIAPLDWFGSETLEQALALCHQLPAVITPDEIYAIPAELPASQFGFEAALEAVMSSDRPPVFPPLPRSGLLPTGKDAVEAVPLLRQQGYHTFKWKIGVESWEEELTWFTELLNTLPADAYLRLDANGGLTVEIARSWLEVCSDRPQVEFLEQPLPPHQFDAMLALSHEYPTPIALDESVATLPQLEACHQQGWRGVVVVKPAIAGSPQRLRTFCQHHTVDLVWSSVFETAIAQRFIQSWLIPSIPTRQRAIGFGVNHWFTDRWQTLTEDDLWAIL